MPSMDHDIEEDEFAGSGRPERLVTFQRKMDKLQGRFGEALKRLAKPPSGAPGASATSDSETQREGKPMWQGGGMSTRLMDRKHDSSDEEIEARIMAQLARRRGLRAGAALGGRQQGGRAQGDGESTGGQGSTGPSSRRSDSSSAAPSGRESREPMREAVGRPRNQPPPRASTDDRSRQEAAGESRGPKASPGPSSRRSDSSSAAPSGQEPRGLVRDMGGRGARSQQPAEAPSRQEEASVHRNYPRGSPKGSPSPPSPTPSSPGPARSPARHSKSPSRSPSPRRAPEALQDLVSQLQSLACLHPPPYVAADECAWLRWWEGAVAEVLDVESACVFLVQGDRLWRGAEEEGEAGAVPIQSAGPVGRAAVEATVVNTSRPTASDGAGGSGTGTARGQEECSAMLCIPLLLGGEEEGQPWGVLQCLREQAHIHGSGRGRLANPPAFEPRDEVVAHLLAQRLGGAMREAKEAKQRRQLARDEALQRLGRRWEHSRVARALREWRVVTVQERSARSQREEEARRAEEGMCRLGEAMGRVAKAVGNGRHRGVEAMQALMRTAGTEGQELMGVSWAALLVREEGGGYKAVDERMLGWGGERDREHPVRVQREALLDAAKRPGRGLVWLKATRDGEDMGALVWEGTADEPAASMMAKAMAPMLTGLISLAVEGVRREAVLEGARRDAGLAADELAAQAQRMAEQEEMIDDLAQRMELLQSREGTAGEGTVEPGPPHSPQRSSQQTRQRSPQRTPERLRQVGAGATSPPAVVLPQQQAHDWDLLLLRHAEGLWRQAGQGRAAVAQHFEIAVTTLPLPRSCRVAQCTLLLKDGPGGAMRSVSGRGEEVVALHGTAVGQAVATAHVVREGNATLYVPIGNVATGGVVRLVLQSGGGGEEGVVEAVQALGALALALLQQSATLQAAMQGMSDAALAVSALQARADQAGSEAARHVAASSRAMGVLEAMEGLHVKGRGGLATLFEAAEQAARAVVGGTGSPALLLLVEEEGEGEEGQGSGKGREMWTLWPVRGTAGRHLEPSEQRQRVRLRIGEGECATELRALASGRPLALSSSSTQGEAWLRQSWTFQHAGKGGPGGYGEATLGPATLLIVPVPGAKGRGVVGVLTVVKDGEEEEGEDEEEVEVLGLLAAQVGSLLSLQHADLALAKLRSEQAHLYATLAGQRGEDERLRRLLVLARCMLDMMGREGHGASAGCRAVEEGLRQYVLHASAGRQDHQPPRVSVRLEADAPALALAASGGTEGPPPPVKIEQRPHMHRHARRQEESEEEEGEEEGEEGGEKVVVTIGGRPVATVAVQWAVEDVEGEEWLLTRVQEAVGLAVRGLASLERVRVQTQADQARPIQQLSSALATLLSDQTPTRPPRPRVVNGALWELWDLTKLAAWGRGVEEGSRQGVGGVAATLVWLSGEGTGEHVQMFTMGGEAGAKAMVGSGRKSGVDVETYVAKWVPWLLGGGAGGQAGRVKELMRDVRRLAGGEEKATAKPVLSVPILAHLPLSEDDVGVQVVAVVVLEREGQEGGFMAEDVRRAALWSRMLTLQVQALAATEHRRAQQKQDVLRRLLGKWERWQAGHALRQWRATRRAQAKREAANERALAKTLKHSHAQAVQSLCACIDVLLCLGGVLEDADPMLLFTELEAQVADKLPAALGATHCTLTLVRRGAVKDRPSGLRLPKKPERPTRPPAEGELVLSRPLLNADNELLGVLEVRLASSLGGGALREVEELVGMLALYLGALVTLLLELAGPDGEALHVTRYSKALDAPATAMVPPFSSAGPAGDLPLKCDLLHALLLSSLSSASASVPPGPCADVSLCRLVSLHAPRLLNAHSAALFLPSSPTSPEASGAERLHCPTQGKGHVIGQGAEEEQIRQCYHTRRRVTYTYTPARRGSLASPTRLTHPPPDSPLRHQQPPVLQDSQEQPDRDEPRLVVKPSGGSAEGVGARVVFEPVMDRERGVVRGVLRVELQAGEAEADREDRLSWVVGLLAEVLEGKGRGEQAGGEERLQAWMGRRYKAWATMLASGVLERPKRSGEAALEALLPRWYEALGDVFGAAHVRMYLGTYRPGPNSTTLPESLSLWTTTRGAKREVKVNPCASLLGSALQAAVLEEGPSGMVLEPWAVGPQALQVDGSDPEVTGLPMGQGDVFGQMVVLARGEEGGLKGRVAVCVVRVVWAAGVHGATDRAGALRPLAAQVGTRLAEAVWALRQMRTDAWSVRHDESAGVAHSGVGAVGRTCRSLLAPGAPPPSPSRDWSRRADGEEGSPMLLLVRDVVPALLQVPLLAPSIEALMRATSLRVESLLLALRRSAHDGPLHSLASVDLLALDHEGLWTVDMQPRVGTQQGEPGGAGYVTVPGGGLQQGLAGGIVGQVIASASAATGAVVLSNAEVHPAFSPPHDLAGVQPWPTARAEDGSLPRVALVYVPIFTLAASDPKPQGEDNGDHPSPDASSLVMDPQAGSPRPSRRRSMKLRGVLRYCLLYQAEASGDEGNVITPSEQQALEALSRVLTGAITILDAAVASKSLNEIYERTEKALGLAQANLESSKQRAQRLHGLTACALLAVLPLFYEPTRQPSSSLGALLLASRGGGAAAGRGGMWAEAGQTHRVAKAALDATLVLLNASTAILYLLYPRSGAEAEGMHVFTHSVSAEAGEEEGQEGQRSARQWGHSTRARPTGHGRQAGLLGRCLKKAQLLNVDRPRTEDRYNPEVDGVMGEGGPGEAAGDSPTLWVPLKWGGHKTPMGVLRVVRKGEDEQGDEGGASPPSPGGVGFTKDEEIMAEVLASHVALSLSYAMGMDQPSSPSSGGGRLRPRPSFSLTTPVAGDFEKREVASTSLLLRLNGSAEGSGLRPREGPLQDRSNLNDRVETNLEEIKRQLHEIQQQSTRSTPVKPRPEAALGGARDPRPSLTTSALGALALAAQDSRVTPNSTLLDVGGPSFASLLSDTSVCTPKAVKAAGGEAKAPFTAAAVKLTALRSENSALSEALQSFLQNPARPEGERRASRPEVAAAKEEDGTQVGGFKGVGDRDDDPKGR